MRVNITYSVDLESVPREVNRLIFKESESLQEIVENLQDFHATNALQKIESLGEIRKYLAHLDARAAECISMLSGYIDFATGNDQVQLQLDQGAADAETI